MFQPEIADIQEAAAALGWEGVPVQVRFGGEDAWVIARLPTAFVDRTVRPEQAPSSKADALTYGAYEVRIVGTIVSGLATSSVVVRASVFAGYCPRAVLVPDGPGVLDVQVAAAMLEQGVVIASGGGVRVLSLAGPTQGGATGAAVAAQLRLSELVQSNLATAGASKEFC